MNILIPVITTLAFIIAAALAAITWVFTCKKLQISISKKTDFCCWGITMLGKYIPGKIWLYGGRAAYYYKNKKPMHLVSLGMMLEIILSLIAASIFAFIMAGGYLLSGGEVAKNYTDQWQIAIAGLFIILIVSHPLCINLCLGTLAKLLKKSIQPTLISYKDILTIILIYFFNWIVFSSFMVPYWSYFDWSFYEIFYASGSLALAGVLGQLAVFSPGGLGVREGILVALLAPLLPLSEAILVAVNLRIYATIGELCFSAGCFLIAKK